MILQAELDAALEAARSAEKIILRHYERFAALEHAPADVSTEADRAAQEAVLQHLLAAFPGDAFCAEEDTPMLRQACRSGPRLWVVDPIDGTRGFVLKNGEFSVMIGLAAEGEVQLGVVLEPATGRCTYAVRGGGCWQTDRSGTSVLPCRVSQRGLAEAILVRSRSDRKPLHKSRVPAAVEQFTYSAGIKLARIARGEADLYVSTYAGFHSWDLCAGQILVQEAGGVVSDIRGKPIHYRQDGSGPVAGVLASNGLLHAHALAHLGPAA